MTTSVSIVEHFKRLFDFSGCEDKTSFWTYAGVALLIIIAVSMIIFVPMMSKAMADIQEFAVQNPDQVTVRSGPGQYSISVRGDHPSFISAGSLAVYLGVSFGLAILLYAAAVVRRLRDRGKSGFWGLMPLPFIVFSSIQMPQAMSSVGSNSQPDMTTFLSVFLSNALYMATLIWLIIILAGPSKDLTKN